jgi:hypothetical protein
MDKIRVSLNKDKQKGIPFDNSRMMDELLQFHIITPNSEGKAIWNGFLNSCTGLCIASLIFSLIGSISNPGGNGRVASTGVVFLISFQ